VATIFHVIRADPLPRAPFDADALLRAALRGERGPCGSFDIRIDRDARWHYRGTPIARLPLVSSSRACSAGPTTAATG
jgi:hypothetical protein